MASALACKIADAVSERLAARKKAFVAFPGGKSPRQTLNELAPLAKGWSGVTIIPTDDRLVPKGDPLSNFAMIAGCLEGVPARLLPLARPPFDDAGAAADAAELRLSELPWPMDIVWLGFGLDGHVASLLPGPDLVDALTSPEWRRVVGVRPVPPPPEAPVPRVTLTLRAILGAGRVFISGSGQAKLDVIKEALEDGEKSEMPLGLVLAGARNRSDIFWSR